MRKSIYIISVLFVALLCACSDEDTLMTEQEKEESGLRTITFSLSLAQGDGFSLDTRSSENIKPVDTNAYAVYMYLFKRDSKNQYILDREPIKMTSPLYSIEGVVEGDAYAYVFAAVPSAQESVLTGVRDFGTASLNEDGNDITTSSSISVASSLLSNSFISFFEDDQSESDNLTRGTFSANRNLNIFADGSYIPAGATYHTPVNLVMTRQFGIIEIELDGTDVSGKEVSCSVNSDYYRLYLSQMIKKETTDEFYYTSENEAVSGDEYGYGEITYDYFSKVNVFVTFKTNLPTFKKTTTVTAEEITNGKYYLQLYLPYTTAYPVAKANEVPTAQYANYNYNNAGGETGPALSLTMPDGKVYKYNSTFPIHRNAKTTFFIEGSKLTTTLGNGGIDLDDDNWDGVQ